MDPKFVSANDIQLRIDGGIVLHDGLPKIAYLSLQDDDTESCTMIKMYTVGSTNEEGERIDANDPSVHTKTLDVGYLNNRQVVSYIDDDFKKPVYHRKAGFVFRGTNRKQKSVIHQTNTYIVWCGQTGPGQIASGLFNSGDFRDMLLDEYPSSRDFSDLQKGESVAVSRNFAVQALAKEQRLYFNGHEIGRRKLDQNYFQLDSGYDHSIMVMRLASLNIPV